MLPDRVDVVAFFMVVATVAVYVVGVRRLAARGRRWPLGRTIAFVSGAVVVVVATQTGVARYDTILFSDHVVQHILLGMVAPVLFALGAPVTLALQSATAPTKLVLRQALDSRVAVVLTHPLTATMLFGVTMFALYFTPLYELSLRNGVVHAWIHIHFVVVGVLFAEAIVGLDVRASADRSSRRASQGAVTPALGAFGAGPLGPRPRLSARALDRHRTSYPARLGLVLATVPFHAVLGVALLSSTSVFAADWYAATGRTWGASALADQRTGAGILWAAGELFGLALGGVVLVRWMAQSEREARRHDRLLDAEMAAH